MIDEKDVPSRNRLETLYNKVLQKRNPNTDIKATIEDIDAAFGKFKKLGENSITVSQSNTEHPVSAVIDYLMVEVLSIYINYREELKVNNNDYNKRHWCVICGALMGKCDHDGPYTDDLDKAYKTWLDKKREEEQRDDL